MATSGALDTSNTYIKYKIKITENSYSTSGNTSNVTVTVNFYRTNSGYTTYGTGTVYCTIDGTQYTASVTSSQKITSSGIDLFSKTLTIAHNSDGSKSLTVSAYISHSQFSSNSQSFTTSLTTIARASSITSASNVTLGNAVSVKWTPATSSYAYKLKFVVGSKSYTTGYISPGTTSAYTYTGYTMSIADWAPYITSATSATCTVTLYTYSSSSSSSSLGSSSTTFTVSVPSSVVPTVSIGSVAEGNSAVGIGVYVQNMSTVKVTFTPTMAYDSSLKSYSVTIGSLSYSGSSLTSGSSKTVTSGTLTTAGSLTITVTVTDARGRSGTATQTITVYEYSAPTIKTFNAQRFDSDGKENDNGEYVRITFEYSVSSLNGLNTADAIIFRKESTEELYISLYESTALSMAVTYFTPDRTFDIEKGWDFMITVTDAFTSVSAYSSVGTGIVPLSVYWNGTGVAIGKVAETGSLFDVALKQHITATPYQLEILNSSSEGATGVWCKSWSGRQVACEVGTGGDNMGVYDQNLMAWMIYTTGAGRLNVGTSTSFDTVYVGNTSTPLYLRGSVINTSGNINNVLVIGSDDTDSERRLTIRTTGAAISMISAPGGNRGIYDYTTDVNAYMMYTNSSRELLIGRSSNLASITLGSSSVPLNLRGSDISYNSFVATMSVLNTDDVDSGISTLAAGTFKDPGSDMLANLTSHTYEENGHKHIALTVDETEAAMQAAGMNPDEYDITEHWIDEDGNEVGAIRYDELIPILINEVQDLQTEVQDLQTQIATLTK